MADDPNKELFPKILALLGAEAVSEKTSDTSEPEHKGIIKDSSDRPKELPANLSPNEKSRVNEIATIFGEVLFPKSEAGRLKMEQTKVGSAVNIPKPQPAPTGPANSILELLKNLGWMALLGGIATAAAALYDNLGALGRGLTKIALKLAPFIGDLAKFGKQIIEGIGMIARGLGRFVTSLGDAFNYFKTKGIAGFIDDLKLKFPKTSQFVDDTIKMFTDFKDWVKKSWFGRTMRSIKDALKAKLGGFADDAIKVFDNFNDWFRNTYVGGVIRNMRNAVRNALKSFKIGAWTKFSDAVFDNNVAGIRKLNQLQRFVTRVKTWVWGSINTIVNPDLMKWWEGIKDARKAADLGDKAKDAGKLGNAIRKMMTGIRGIGAMVSRVAGWMSSAFGAIKEVAGVASTLFKGKGGVLRTMLGGLMRFLGKMAQPLLRKLPYIGAAFSLGFAFARFQKGEYLPAGLELISAILAFIPGIGTAGSIIIDGALMLYDMDKQKKEDEAKGIQPKESGGFFGKIKKWVGDWLVPKLRYLPIVGAMFYYADSISAFMSGDIFNGIDNLLKGLIAIVGGKGLVDIVNSAYPVIKEFFSSDKKEEPQVNSESSGGFFSNLLGKIGGFLIPKLRYIPVIGAFFYGKDAWDAFSEGSWGKGLLNLAQAIIALVGFGPVGSVINMGIDFVSSFFKDEEQSKDETKEGEGGFFSWIKDKFKEVMGNREQLSKVPFMNAIFYGSDAWNAFKSGEWGKGFKFLGLAILSALPITGIAQSISLGINWILSFFDDNKEQGQPEEMKSGGGFWDSIKGAWEAIGGIVVGAIDYIKNWLSDSIKNITEMAKKALSPSNWFSDNEKPTVTSDGKKIYSEKTKQNARASGWGEDVEGYDKSNWAQKEMPVAQAATPAAAPTPTTQPVQAATPPTTTTQAATPAASQTETERRAKAMGWSTVDEYKNSGWKENPLMAKGIQESTDTVLKNAKAMGWGTVEEYKNSGWKQNPAVVKGAENAEDPVLLRNAKAMGWNTVDEYKNSGWKQNPAIIANATQAAIPAAATPAVQSTGVQAALAMPATASSPLAQAYQTSAPSASMTPSSPMLTGSSAMESIADFTFRKEAQLKGGKLAVYKPPAGDGGGAFEVAGITARYQPKEAAELKALVEAGRHQEAESKAKLFFAKRAEPFIKHTNRAGIQLQLTDIVHNRGEGGLRSILQRATGMTGEKDYQKLIETLNADPQALEKLHKARVSYEMEVVDRGRANRAKFRQGLMNRFSAAYTASQEIESRGGAPAASTPAMAAAPAASTPVTATPASGPPYTEQSSMPAATQNTNTATGAATLGIMSAFGIQQTPTAAPSQFQSQAINIPVAGGTTSSTKWSGGESNFVINGADMGGLNSEFRRRLESMAAEYKEKTGKKINVSGARSAYRSYAQQVAIAKTARPGYAATPGTSNHGFGFALDINTADANKAESLGLLQKYGLHRPMMSKSLYEPWHIEPVGLNKAALAQYRAKRQSGQFTGDQLAFALSGSGSAGPPYTEQSVMPVAGIAATPAASGVAMTSSSISDTMAASSATVPNTEAGSSGGGFGFGGLFSGISNIFTSSSPSVQSTEGGIANLSTSSTPSPMPAMGAESSITSKMDDIASKHINKVNEEITVMKGIDASIKELTKQINALSRITINNVSGGDSKTSITSANIPDTESRLKPQTGGGFLSGKMFGFG